MPDAIVLCGGLGLRLRSVTAGAPKPMACIGGRPFLGLLLGQLERHGWERVILAAGYKGEVIRDHFGERAFGLEVVHSCEPEPLGTGGALQNALPLVKSDPVLVMNGDSYTEVDLRNCIARHSASGAEVSIVVSPQDGREDSGAVAMDTNGSILGFAEKQRIDGMCYASSGIYVMSRAMLQEIPAGRVSLEQELFPKWIGEGRKLSGIVCQNRCVDIGTPERYWSAQDLLANRWERKIGSQQAEL